MQAVMECKRRIRDAASFVITEHEQNRFVAKIIGEANGFSMLVPERQSH